MFFEWDQQASCRQRRSRRDTCEMCGRATQDANARRRAPRTRFELYAMLYAQKRARGAQNHATTSDQTRVSHMHQGQGGA